MLTLEQVRVVNDGLKQGDLSAALKPLEEQIDLRHAELPRLDKAALAALKTGLQEAENAHTWVEAVFHPNVSVRRFARKTLLGLRSEAAPLAPHLQARLEQFWAEETPLPWANSAREAAARRDQFDRVENAIEILLRADPHLFMTFWGRLSDAAQPVRERQDQENQQWRERQVAYSQAYRQQSEAALQQEYGENYQSLHLPARLLREVYERVQNSPEIVALREDMGENSWIRAAQEWHPNQLCAGALQQYLQPEATGPQREVAAQVRVYFWKWVNDAFDSEATPEEREQARQRAVENFTQLGYHGLLNALGREQVWERLPELLEVNRSGPDSAVPLWNILVQVLAQSCQRPFNVKENDWEVPERITPDFLLGFKIEEQGTFGVNYHIEQAAKSIEKAHRQKKAEAEKDAARPVEPVEAAAEALPMPPLGQPLNLSFTIDYTALNAELQRTGEDWQTLHARKSEELRREIEAIESIDEKIEKLLEPLPSRDFVKIQHLTYWQVWQNQMGHDALMQDLWPRVGSRLWVRYEAKLEEYRRVETEEIAPHIGEKLTANELKEWKTNQRRAKRNSIHGELNDIALVLRAAEGFEADLKLLQVLERPGFKELLTIQYRWLLSQVAHYKPSDGVPPTREQNSDAEWLRQNWFLDAKWLPLLEKIEAYLLSQKRVSPWENESALRQLALAHYRLDTPASRARFRELAQQVESLGMELVYPVMALEDTDTWLLLISKPNHTFPDLQNLWKQIQKSGSAEAMHLTARLLDVLSSMNAERSAKFVLEMLGQLSPTELAAHSEAIVSLLESPLVPVKRWVLATLPTLPNFEYDTEAAARLVSEMLWSESALPKEAAKFLGTLGGNAQAAALAWEELCGATSLENITVLESIFRALIQLRSKNADLMMDDAARERLEALAEAQPERFTKFAKKLI